ncbi:MAG: undecaprenyldiphospho-muramoylpentapeptide beta-N-acetylglucosaminyltransferase [Candidatus Portnoybacteria bacterium]|nr:undecaprenyldiphospho-muramoylpentapeptide beta-N-acetylglucosaminyltransferase [Candidatus Portnoybacteria bacterium]
MRIVFAGGGTGGHLFPIVAVARELKKISKEEIEMMFIGPPTIGEDVLAKEEIKAKFIQAGKFYRYFSFRNFLSLIKLTIGFLQSLWILFRFMPNVIFNKSGFGSIPVILAAWIYRIPILTHESDSIPGLSARFAAKMSKRVAVSFPRAKEFFPPEKTALTGNPIRSELASGSKEEAKTIFGLEGNKPLILVLGGSQGAQAINDIFIAIATGLLIDCEIIHQSGQKNYQIIKTLFLGNLPAGYHLFPFLDEEQMKQALSAADLIVSRAGSSHIFEIAACGKPSILIPLPSAAGDHQKFNAFDFAQSGAAVVINQENLTPNFLKNKILSLVRDSSLLSRMSAAAKNFIQIDAANHVAEEVLNIAKK